MNKKKIIIGISGKKQSGKTSLCEYLSMRLVLDSKKAQNDEYKKINLIQDEYGLIHLEDNEGNSLNVSKYAIDIKNTIANNIKTYNFADPLKKIICNQMLGLDINFLYGNDKQKNQYTQYDWDKMPLEVRKKYGDIDEPKTGKMTYREIMQVVGTDIFREMFYQDVWIDFTMNLINHVPNAKICFIPDVRFPSEVKSIVKNGGYVIRLSRSLYEDSHPSETSLDDYIFSQHKENAYLVDNSVMSIDEKNKIIYKLFKENILSKYNW